MSRPCLLLAAAAAASFAPLAQAQTSTEATPAAATQEAGGLEEIVVTATRKEEVLSRVPISVTAFNQDAMDQRGIRDVGDLLALVPGVQFGHTGFGAQTQIAIRGIASTVGPATTGVYIDDIPIQVRTVGFSSTTAFPDIFDLDRVEVLRGPQGTLFGAGAEGGAVRFITPSVNFREDSGYFRTEVAQTQNGDISYEAGAAKGGVLINDQLAFRASAYYRRDGGFIDRIPYPAAAGPDEPEHNSNWSDAVVLHGQLGWHPTDRLTLTLGLFSQQIHTNDSSNFWVTTPDGALSDPRAHRYINGNGEPETSNDNFFIPSLSIGYRLDWATLSSTTSYMTRYAPGQYDYRLFMNATFGGGANPLPVFATPGYFDNGLLWNRQSNWSQEIRLASNDTDARLSWVTGVFLQSAVQSSAEILNTPFFDITTGIPNASVLFFGAPLVDGKYVYIDYNRTRDNQFAGFGEVNFKVTEGLKLTAGVRVARSEVYFTDIRAAPGDGFGTSVGSEKQNPVTPKFGVAEQIDEHNMVYATASKGYRSGGANRPLPVNPQCTADLASLGFTAAPATYESDSVWSYEVGSKNAFLDNRLRVATSAYYVKWKDIINDVALPSCGLDFIANLGKATSKGFDLQLETRPLEALYLSTSVGYSKATYDKTVEAAGARAPIVRGGWTLGGAPWIVSAAAQYNIQGGVVGAPSYLRADYYYRTRNDGLQALNDPTSASYNPNYPVDPAQQNLNLRLGWLVKSWDLSLFVNNVTNTHYELNVNNQALLGRIIEATAVRPRTYGLTISGHF
jgi:iron complex outermembrane recepter protein